MASNFDVAAEWRKSLYALQLTKMQWDKWDQRKKEVLSKDEILQVDMTFAEIQYFADCHTHNVECLVGFWSRYEKLNKCVMKAAVKMGFGVKMVSDYHLVVPE